MTVEQEIKSIQSSLDNFNAARPETISPAISSGQNIRQGDVYLIRLSALPCQCHPAKSSQLAPGTTQGSRHTAEGNCVVLEPADKSAVALAVNQLDSRLSVPSELVGPIVECRAGRTTFAHPEHGHKLVEFPSFWAVVYQRAYADEIRRVLD